MFEVINYLIQHVCFCVWGLRAFLNKVTFYVKTVWEIERLKEGFSGSEKAARKEKGDARGSAVWAKPSGVHLVS